ncbi:cytosolic Fe-S cluster assembly factor cfd1, partial [Trichoglossum hirsutum]
VLSGKGGVGKSSVTAQLGLALSLLNKKTGILDVDLTGPSMPHLLSVASARVTQGGGGWQPVTVHDADAAAGVAALSCMSLGFLLGGRGDAVVWRGPKKTAMVRQFLGDVEWGALDVLLVDTPPGTSDEHIALAEALQQPALAGRLAGAVLVTTPQAVATADVRKELNFCRKTRIPLLGLVENLSGFVCPHCAHCTNIFSRGGGALMADDYSIPLLAAVPVDPQLVSLLEDGRRPVYPPDTDVTLAATAPPEADDNAPLVEKYRACSLCPIFMDIARKIIAAPPENGSATESHT